MRPPIDYLKYELQDLSCQELFTIHLGSGFSSDEDDEDGGQNNLPCFLPNIMIALGNGAGVMLLKSPLRYFLLSISQKVKRPLMKRTSALPKI